MFRLLLLFIVKTYNTDNYEMTNIFNVLHLLIHEAKLYSYTNIENSRAAEPDQFCSGARTFFTALQVNPPKTHSGS